MDLSKNIDKYLKGVASWIKDAKDHNLDDFVEELELVQEYLLAHKHYPSFVKDYPKIVAACKFRLGLNSATNLDEWYEERKKVYDKE